MWRGQGGLEQGRDPHQPGPPASPQCYTPPCQPSGAAPSWPSPRSAPTTRCAWPLSSARWSHRGCCCTTGMPAARTSWPWCCWGAMCSSGGPVGRPSRGGGADQGQDMLGGVGWGPEAQAGQWSRPPLAVLSTGFHPQVRHRLGACRADQLRARGAWSVAPPGAVSALAPGHALGGRRDPRPRPEPQWHRWPQSGHGPLCGWRPR